MISTYGEVINRIAERTVDNYKQLRTDKNQRRLSFVDLYGIEYLRQGDASHPATFYVSISPDFMYYERFALKLQIMPFVSSVSGVNFQGATIGTRSLSVNGNSITPNPHDHPISINSSGAEYGLHFIDTTSENWSIKIHGVDVTPYLKAQQDGAWISGEGIYPNNRTELITDFYDILAVACDMYAEGNKADADKLLAPEAKQIEIISDAPFQVATMVYVKFSTVNR